MAIEQLSSNDKTRIREFIDDGIVMLQEIKDRKESLKDLTKQVATELNTKPGVVMEALNTAFSDKLAEKKEKQTEVEMILEAAGRLVG